MNSSVIRSMTYVLIFPLMMIAPLGCASRNLQQQDTFKEYKTMLEK